MRVLLPVSANHSTVRSYLLQWLHGSSTAYLQVSALSLSPHPSDQSYPVDRPVSAAVFIAPSLDDASLYSLSYVQSSPKMQIMSRRDG